MQALTDEEAADEIERLRHKVYELEVELREAQASVDLRRDFVEADVNKLRTENERLKAENDWLRTGMSASADRLKEKEREIVMILGGRQHHSVR